MNPSSLARHAVLSTFCLVAGLCLAEPPAIAPAAKVPQSIAGCEISDITGDFWTFWDAAGKLPAAERLQRFEQMVKAPNAAIYEGIFRNSPRSADSLIGASLGRVFLAEGRMRTLSANLARELPVHLSRFREAFPDFQCTTPVVLVYSSNAFDGAVRTVDGKRTLMFGIDVIALLDESLPALMAHELFHVHHRNRVGESSPKLFWAIWTEGLATYVSGQMNPDLVEADACCLPAIGPAERMSKSLIADALPRLDSEAREDNARFLLGGNKDGASARGGYYLGYLVARELGRTRNLNELAGMKPDEIRPLMEEQLRAMQRDGAPRIAR